MNVDQWGPPLLVLGLGGLGAALWMSNWRGSASESDAISAEGHRNDLMARRHDAVRALRELEQEKGKMSDADYQRERAVLLARGAEALRELEAVSPGAAAGPLGLAPQTMAVLAFERQRLGDDVWRSELLTTAGVQADGTIVAAPKAVPPPLIAPEWKGALAMLATVLCIAGLWWLVQDNTSERGAGGTMTGGMGSGGAPMSSPGGPVASANSPERAELLKQIEANPKDVQANNRLTVLSLTEGDMGAAMKYNETALDADAKDPDARSNRALLRARIGMNDEAYQLLDDVMTTDPTFATAPFYKGMIALGNEDYKIAVESLEKALALGLPDSPMLQQALAEARAGGPPAGGAPAAPSGPAETLVKGTVTIDPTVEGMVSQAQVLYISVRDPAGGPPLAAKKLPVGPFPLTFEITTADRLPMGGDRPVPAVIDVNVRLDFDGNAMSKADGEPAASFPGTAAGANIDAVLK